MAAEDLKEWEAEIEEERREEQAEKERRAEEKSRRLEREEAEAYFVASPGWEQSHVPLHVCTDRAIMEALARNGIPTACIPPTAAGAKRLADALRAQPPRERSRDYQLVWVLPVVSATDAAWDQNYDEDAYAAQSKARGEAYGALLEFQYLCRSNSDSPLGYVVHQWHVPEWPSGDAAAEYLADWEEALRETPQEKWLREKRSILVTPEELDAFTDEQMDAYVARLKKLGPMPADPAPLGGEESLAPPPPAPGADAGQPVRPSIRTNAIQYRDLEREAHAALVAANSPPTVFVGAGGLSELYRPEPDGTRRVRLLTAAALRRVLAEVADWEHKTERKTVAALPPPQLLVSYLARAEWPGVPDLVTVTTCPILRADGVGPRGASGYDPVSRRYYEPNGSFDPVPPAPTRGAAVAAARELLHGFRDFLLTDIDRSVVLSGIFSIVARPLIGGPVPLHVFSAAGTGSGKTAICRAIALIATGEEITVADYPCSAHGGAPADNGEEIGKRAVTCAKEATVAYLFDNIATGHQFGCAQLDAAVTMTKNGGRLLGTNDSVKRPAETVYFASGNNVAPRGDTLRRSICAYLAPGHDKAYKAKYQSVEITEWARKERGRLLPAALTILSAYLRAGCPDQGLAFFGGFESWSRIVRGAIAWCGFPDPVKTQEPFEGDDPETAAAGALIALMDAAGANTKPVTTAHVVALVVAELKEYQENRARVTERTHAWTSGDWDAFVDTAPIASVARAYRLAMPDARWPDARKLGLALNRYKRKVCGGRRVVRADDDSHEKVAKWKVESVSESPPAA